MTTIVINAQKNAPRDTNSDKQRRNKMQNIRTETDEKGDKQASTFEERYQELEEKIKQKAAAAKSDLKQYEDGKPQ